MTTRDEWVSGSFEFGIGMTGWVKDLMKVIKFQGWDFEYHISGGFWGGTVYIKGPLSLAEALDSYFKQRNRR